LEAPTSFAGEAIRRIEGADLPDLYRPRIGGYRVLFARRPEAVTILRVISRQDLEKTIRQLTP
jgi:mRNA-degrading endonuclease RelE of RelBE toxin-antitoxin system